MGIGNGPKFKYGKTTDYPTKRQKSAFGNDSVKAKGTGKAKFECDEKVNMDGYSDKKPKKSVKKVETKEDDMINIKDGDKEYMIKLAESEEMSFVDKFKELDFDNEEIDEDFSFEDDSETLYEIEVDSTNDEDGDDFNLEDDDDDEESFMFEGMPLDLMKGNQSKTNSELGEDDERTYEIEFSDEDDSDEDDSDDEGFMYGDTMESIDDEDNFNYQEADDDNDDFMSLDDAIMEAIKKSSKPKGYGIVTGKQIGRAHV